MEQSIIERAAQALFLVDYPEYREDGDISELGMIAYERRALDYREGARAVLAVIREPSGGMLDATTYIEPRAGWWPDEPGDRNGPDEIWRAMIDAALSEG